MGFLVLIGFILVVVRMALNLGQLSQVRAETSNAADAGALAAASWMASGQNEGTWVSRKMWDSASMIQGLYLVPFAPGDAFRVYAENLWTYLALRGGGVCQRGDLSGCGPVGYFREVANGVMETAWNVGRREFLTAAINNMLIRFSTGTRCRGVPIGTPCPPDAIVDPSTDLRGIIRDHQQWLYDQAGLTNPTIGSINWNNGLPLTNPRNLTHLPLFRMTNYPAVAPTLRTQGLEATYYQYGPLVRRIGVPPAIPSPFIATYSIGGTCCGGPTSCSVTVRPFFDCNFPMPAINGGTLPELSSAMRSPPSPDQGPLSVDEDGNKRYDVPLENVIPAIGSGTNPVSLDPNRLICGIESHTVTAEVAPTPIQGGTGQVTVTISHEVRVARPGPPDTVPAWPMRFNPVASEARASFTQASVPAQWEQPPREAEAQLTNTR